MNSFILIILAFIIVSLFFAALVGGLVFLVVMLTRKKDKTPKANKITIEHPEVPTAQPEVAKSLSEVLKENRIRCNMTQEFVAEQLDVSRQAVSKWENGTSDPSTANLIALSKLYHISTEELLKEVHK